MRCYSCNCILTPRESVRRFSESQDFVDLCNTCLSTIDEDVDTVDGAYVEEDENESED